jgi:hypothetical protein
MPEFAAAQRYGAPTTGTGRQIAEFPAQSKSSSWLRIAAREAFLTRRSRGPLGLRRNWKAFGRAVPPLEK